MKRFLLSAALGWVTAVGAQAATTPLFLTTFPIISPPAIAPQIDATAWANQSLFQYSDFNFNSIPFQTLNTRFFTNRSSGVMISEPGFRFDHSFGNVRAPMGDWVNEGSISVDNGLSFFLTSSTLFTQPGSWLLVSATNITSPGALNGGEISLVKLEGENINLARAPIRVGSILSNVFFFGGSSIGSSNYFNDPGVLDIYWGVGDNNRLDTMGNPMSLPNANFTPPFPSSPIHQVVQPSFASGFFFTNSIILPNFSFQPYGAFVLTNQLSPTNAVIQVVLMPTNSFDTNLTTEVQFFRDGDNGAAVVVGFHSVDFDIVTRRQTTNSVFLTDALAFDTNVFIARNLNAPTRRPSTFEVTRTRPFFGLAVPTNATFDSSLIFNSSYASNSVGVRYAAYGAQVSSLPATSLQQTQTGELTNPTNFPGRVEIRGKNVNLDRARIRAEATVIIQAENLTSSQVGQVDAPYVNLDLGTAAPVLTISNVVPRTVRRLSGQISAWSAIWENSQVTTNLTNQLQFHVLIVDPSFNFDQSVVINELALRGNLVRLEDSLSVGSKFEMEATSADVHGFFSLPFGTSLGAFNLIGLLNFTNHGIINVPGAANYGADRPLPYDNYVNHGTNIAAAQLVRSRYFENTGLLSASGGVLSIQAEQMLLTGPPAQVVTNISTNFFFDFFSGTIGTNITTNVTVVGGALRGSADIELIGIDVLASNSVLSAGAVGQPGKLVMNVTNSLNDAGPGSTNLWSVSSGFELRQRPASGDLLFTHLTSVVDPFRAVDHVWAGENRGAVPDGFTNNTSLGILTLEGGEASFMTFRGAGTNDALYVDFIELVNTATNFDNSGFVQVDPSLKIYFAHANVPAEKLDGAANGQFVWVSSYAGPNSSTNLIYPSGSNVVANIALVQSKDLDSDGDGIPNADDPTPVFVPDDVALALEYSGSGGGGGVQGMASLSWVALAWSTNYLEYKESVESDEWTVLTQFVQAEVTTRVHVNDPVTGTNMRIYRVRQEPR